MNLSSVGVLFTASLNMEVGEQIDYIITFPTGSASGGVVYMRCLGSVVRTGPGKSDRGGKSLMLVAATLERYEFLRNSNLGPSTQ